MKKRRGEATMKDEFILIRSEQLSTSFFDQAHLPINNFYQ